MTRNIAYKILAAAFTIFLTYIIYSAIQGDKIIFFKLVRMLPFGDKIGHFMLIGTLTFLINLALSCKTFVFQNRNILIGSFVVFIIFTIEEFSQIGFKNRSFDPADLLSNYLGILAASYLIIRFFKKK